MSDEQTPEPVEQAKKPKAKPAPSKPKRVKMRNTRADNGEIGGIAQPWEKDVPAWEAAGWERA